MTKMFSNEAFAVMHISNFRLFMAYRFFMTAAVLMQAVIVGWQLYDITIFVGSSNELGAFESGAAAILIGLVPSVIFGGVMTLIVVGVATFSAPRLRNLLLKNYSD